jgi:hypothetical protein
MRSLRITPINIATAAVLLWLAVSLWEGSLKWSNGIMLAVLVVVLVAADQYFRVFFKVTERIWLIEIVFLVLVGAAALLLRWWLN